MPRKKGGKIKASDVLAGVATASGLGSAVTTATGIGAPVAGVLGTVAGVSAGVSKILKLFGAGLSQKEIEKLHKIREKHGPSGKKRGGS